MFVLALAMEIYGTALGNWTWRPLVPWLEMATINPPLTAGVFYCVLDMLVVTTVARFMKQPVLPTSALAPQNRVGAAQRNPPLVREHTQ
jgi:hypothetical protein